MGRMIALLKDPSRGKKWESWKSTTSASSVLKKSPEFYFPQPAKAQDPGCLINYELIHFMGNGKT